MQTPSPRGAQEPLSPAAQETEKEVALLANDEEEDQANDDELTGLRIGDFITLRNIPASTAYGRGFLSAEGILSSGMEVSERPKHFHDCVFQICIQFQYSALKEYEENIQFLDELQAIEDEDPDLRQNSINTNGTSPRPKEESDAQKLSKLVGSLKRSMLNEKRLNETYMRSSIGNPIKFGSTIQLLHVKSRTYITVAPDEVASMERENLSVKLSELGSSLSWFTLLPCYKIDREGDRCNSGASLILRVTERVSEQLHCCEKAISESRDDADTRREVNCSLEATGWRVVMYSPYHDEQDKSFYAGEIVRLVDPERNSVLKVEGRSSVVLMELEEDFSNRIDSSALWVVEGHSRPAIGGAITYGESRSFRLRHLNTNRYLYVGRKENMWKKGARLVSQLAAFGKGFSMEGRHVMTEKEPHQQRGADGRDDKHQEYIYKTSETGLVPSCALTFNTPYGALTKRGGSGVMEVANGSPVQISCKEYWMHAGDMDVCESDNRRKSEVNASTARPGALSLIFERYLPPKENLDLVVGIDAYPQLVRFFQVITAHGSVTREVAAMEIGFYTVVDQLACFLLNRELTEDPFYELLNPNELRDMPEARQNLLLEQGVLDVLIAILKRLDIMVEDATARQHAGRRMSSVQRADAKQARYGAKSGASLARVDEGIRGSTAGGDTWEAVGGAKGRRRSMALQSAARGTSTRGAGASGAHQVEEAERLQRAVGGRVMWILLLATRENNTIQLQVADHMQVFISYVPHEPVATAFLVHMLNTNLPLQETKVSEEETRYIVRMVSESRMQSLYLDLLQALCSCSGSGVDCNQCRVVEFWMQGGAALHCRLTAQGTSREAAKWTLGTETGFAKPPPDLVLHVHGHELLENALPALYLSWDTAHKDLQPRSMAGFGGTQQIPIQAIYRADLGPGESIDQQANRNLVGAYFQSQLFLAAELCLDRNYLSIGMVTEQFPFVHCLAMIQDQSLPNDLKAAVVRIVSTAYVDTDPSVKQVCPHLAHVWSDLAVARPTMGGGDLDQAERVGYLLLQDILDQYLNNTETPYDSLKQRMMELLLKLVQFSFYATTEEMQRLVSPLLSDLSKREEQESGKAQNAMSSKAVKSAAILERIKAKRGPMSSVGRKYRSSSISPLEEESDMVEESEQLAKRSMLSRCCCCCICLWKCVCFKITARPNSWQAKWFLRLDSVRAMAIVLALVIALLVFFSMGVEDITIEGWWSQAARNTQRGDSDTRVVTPVSVASTSCTVTLVFEVCTRWYCYSIKEGKFWWFLRDPRSFPFNIIDALLMMSDVGSLVINFNAYPAIKGAKILRIIKLVRVARAAKVLHKVVEYDDEEEEEVTFELPSRYRFTPLQQIQTMLEIVTVLGEVSLVHRECNLIALLSGFKRVFKGAPTKEVLKIYSSVVAKAPRLAALASTTLCDSAEANGVDVSDKEFCASRRFDEIFLDLCLYEHDGLVQAALNLLMVQHSVREALIRDVSATQLLSEPSEEAQYRRLKSVLQGLQSDAERHELWGDIEDEAEKATNEKVKAALRELAAVCMRRRDKPGARCAYEPIEETQTLLFNLGALDVAMTVIDLESSMTDDQAPYIKENTKDIIRLCMIFLQWFVRSHRHNQMAAYEYLDRFVDCFEHDVLSASVIAEMIRGNVELTKNFPLKIVTECSNQIIKGGRNYCYLDLMAALLFLEEGAVENNVEMQFAVLRELSRPARDEPMMWLCQEQGSIDYLERTKLMRQSTELEREASVSRRMPRNMTPSMDEEYMPPLLRYTIKLLEVLAGCADGSIDITTVEAKLQNLYSPAQLLAAILDPHTTLNLRYALSMFLYHTTVEVEINIPLFELDALVWQFIGTFPEAFRDAVDCCAMPLDRGLLADGPVGVNCRLMLAHATLCANFVRVFMERYVPGPSSWREVETDPVLVDAHGGVGKRKAAKPKNGVCNQVSQALLEEASSNLHVPDVVDEDDGTPSWLDNVMEDNFKSLTVLFDVDADIMPKGHRLAFHDALARLSMSLHGSQFHVPPLLEEATMISEDQPFPMDTMTPAAAFRRFVEGLNTEECIDTGEDVLRIVDTFNSIPRLADASRTTELRIEPLIMKLVNHTIARMRPSARGKKLDPECTRTARWLVKIFRAMIEKKWGMSIDERDDDGGEEQDEAAYDLQLMLNRCGVTKLCLLLIAPGIDRELALEGIKLCIALLFREGGNTAVQRSIHQVLVEDCEQFFKAVREYMLEIKNYYLYGDPPLVEDPDEDVDIPGTCMVMRFLQLMSEGHFEPNQDIMREQAHTSINLLDDFVELLAILSRDKHRCRSSTKAALQAASTVLEVIQGPCKKNQMHLAIHTELVEILNRITRSKPIRDCVADEDNETKKCALEIYEGLLEGETGESVIITRIISVIDLEVLKEIIEEDDDGTGESELSEMQMESAVLCQMFFDYKPELRDSIRLSRRINNLLAISVTSVEVVWDGVLLRRFFPVPAICKHISEATRQKLVTEVDRTTDELRLQDFLVRTHDIFREITHQELLRSIELGNVNLSTIFSRRNQEYATWLAFFTACVINGIMMAYARHERTDDDENPRPFNTKENDHMWVGSSAFLYNFVLTPLNFFNIMLSSFTLLLFVVVRCPVTYGSLIARGNSPMKALTSTLLDKMTMYYFIYTVLAVMGLKYRICSAFLLLDIIVKDPTSQDVINAIVYPRKQLGATALLGFFVVYIFAMVMFKSFSDDYSYEDPDEPGGFPEDCRSLLRCMAVTMMYGLRLSGGIGDIMKHTWSTRLWIDFLYFLIVLIVLLNVIFGIIIDTFGELRNQKGERLRKTVENCFICGLDGLTFDRSAPEPGGFRRHIRDDHRMWDYLHFIIFIWEQDKDEDDGLELFVRTQIERSDITWLPNGRALCLAMGDEGEDSIHERVAIMERKLGDAAIDAELRMTKAIEASVHGLHKLVEHHAKDTERALSQLKDGGGGSGGGYAPRADGRPPGGARGRDWDGDEGDARGHPRTPEDRGKARGDRSRSRKTRSERGTKGAVVDDDGAAPTPLTLYVDVHAAAGLVDTHLLGSGDPYVYVALYCRGEKFGQTDRIAMTSRPTWASYNAVYKLERPPLGEAVTLEVWHCHRRGKGHFLGMATLDVDRTRLSSSWGRRTAALDRKPGAKAQTYVQGTLEMSAKLVEPRP